MTNFRALNTLTIHSNISKIRVVIQITLCRNARSKNNRFSAEEAINYITRTEVLRRKKVPLCEMLSPLGLCPPPCFQFSHGN